MNAFGGTPHAHVDRQFLGVALADSAVIPLAAVRCGRIAFANPAFISLFRAASDLLGVPLAELLAAGDADRLAEELAAAGTAPIHFLGAARRHDDGVFDVELRCESVVLDGEPTLIAFACDVTEQHHCTERLGYLAYTDTLTGLANRALFTDRLHQALMTARRTCGMFAVLMTDLDGFKDINDGHGHECGDLALQVVGQRFHGCVRADDTLARIGGDEFAVLLPRLVEQEVATLVARRMLAALVAPLDFGADRVTVGASIGIAVWPLHAGSSDALLAAADTAMYRAKRTGRNRIEWASGHAGDSSHALPPLAWSTAHSVGIEEIDDQHVHLAALIDQVAVALRNGLEREAIRAGLDELVRFTAVHFATEERLMAKHAVPDVAQHKEEHRRLLHDIRTLQVDNELPSISLTLRYLQEWLLRHVDGLDRELGQTLMSQGVR